MPARTVVGPGRVEHDGGHVVTVEFGGHDQAVPLPSSFRVRAGREAAGLIEGERPAARTIPTELVIRESP